MASFVHLRVYSDYSMLQGMIRLEDLVPKVAKEQMPAIALTDCDNMFGAMELYTRVDDYNHKYQTSLKCILGMELYTRTARGTYPMVFLAKNFEGYYGLMQLSSLSARNKHLLSSQHNASIECGYVDIDDIKPYKQHFIVLSGGISGEVATNLRKGNPVKDLIEGWHAFFGRDNYYLEVQHHDTPQEMDLQKQVAQLSKVCGVPLVATNAVHYLEREDAPAHEVLLRIKSKRIPDNREKTGQIKHFTLPGKGYHLKSYEEMLRDFSDLQEALHNTVHIAQRCQIVMPRSHVHYPLYTLPDDKRPEEELRDICFKRLHAFQNEPSKTYCDRLDYELKIISEMGFASYFLVVADFVNNAKHQNILVGPGRGSAAGSLVSYLMGITGVDPIHYGLLFERFLNPERISLPDVDIDFQDDKREDVITYCRKKYGSDHVAQIITYGKLKAKAVLKDVARVFGIHFEDANRLSALMGKKDIRLKDAYENITAFREAMNSSRLLKQIYRYALALEGLRRQTGVHASGVVIADKPIGEYVPLTMDEEGNVLTQYEGELLEKQCGLIKMDFLGLRTLLILEECRLNVERKLSITLNLDRLPLDDKKTYQLLSQGHSLGVFQLESEGMRKYLRDLRPNSLLDITAMNAMYRPGPMDWIPVYIAKKHGVPPRFTDTNKQKDFMRLESILAHNKALKSILGSTNGIPIYQEQIMEIGTLYGGFSLAKADLMRRAMGKKKKNELDKIQKEFIHGASQNGYAKSDALFLFEKIIMPFAGYGFNKSHAVCYALIAYQTAYLKAHYTSEFMAALLNSVLNRPKKIETYVKEAIALGVDILPVDINLSAEHFTASKHQVRYGFRALKDVGKGVSQEIVARRMADGRYRSFEAFMRRVGSGCNRQCLEALVKAGAFDALGYRVSALLAGYEKVLEGVIRDNKIKASGQAILFGEGAFGGGENAVEDALPSPIESTLKMSENVREEDTATLERYEREALGFSLKHDSHLRYREVFRMHEINLSEGSNPPSRKAVGGIVLLHAVRNFRTKKNEEMAFLKLKNHTGTCEGVVFTERYQRLKSKNRSDGKPLLTVGTLLRIKGTFQNRRGEKGLIVDKAEEYIPQNAKSSPEHQAGRGMMSSSSAAVKNELLIEFEHAGVTEDQLLDLKNRMYRAQGGNYRLVLIFPREGEPHTNAEPFETTIYVKANEALIHDLNAKDFIKDVRMS